MHLFWRHFTNPHFPDLFLKPSTFLVRSQCQGLFSRQSMTPSILQSFFAIWNVLRVVHPTQAELVELDLVGAWPFHQKQRTVPLYLLLQWITIIHRYYSMKDETHPCTWIAHDFSTMLSFQKCLLDPFWCVDTAIKIIDLQKYWLLWNSQGKYGKCNTSCSNFLPPDTLRTGLNLACFIEKVNCPDILYDTKHWGF